MKSGQETENSVVAGDAGSTATREQISRWMDGDIAANEIELAMKTLASDEVRYCWAELHFVGDCIRGLEPTRVGCADRIRAAIAAEPTVVAPTIRVARERTLLASMRKMGRGGRAWATAAAVAAVGFVGTVTYQEFSTTGENQRLAKSTASATVVADVGSPQASGAAVVPVVSPDFNALLRAHQESADANSMYSVRQYLRPAVAVQGSPAQ